MLESGNLSQKGSAKPELAYMHYCREYELLEMSKDKSQDGLNGTLQLSNRDLETIGVETGDEIILYVEHKDNWICTKVEVYPSRAAVTLPKKCREELGLERGEQTVEYWIANPADYPYEVNPVGSSEVNQPTLNDSYESDRSGENIPNQNDDDELVWVMESTTDTYHHVRGNEKVTYCGIDFSDKKSKMITDPGDTLEECGNCARSSSDMTNRELVDWFGTRAGFDNDDSPSYMDNEQMMKLKQYIEEIEAKIS